VRAYSIQTATLLIKIQQKYVMLHEAFFIGRFGSPTIFLTTGDILYIKKHIISAFQSLLFAMWMDIQDNERLYK
jgi:hypothetical protein